jgi:hypothetical protein
MVAGLYGELGFTSVEQGEGGRQVWQYEVPLDYAVKSSHIHRASQAEAVTHASGRN